MPSKIKKRGQDSYLFTVCHGYGPDGKQKVFTKTVKCTSRQAAEREYALFLAEIERGQVATSGKMTLADFAEKWFKEHCQKTLAPKTQRTYRLHLERRIIPALGHIQLSKLQPLQVMEFINNLQEPGLRLDGKSGTLSGHAVMYCYRVLSSMLHDAVQLQLIPSNPCDRVKPPTVKKNRTAGQIFNEKQIAILLSALEHEPIKYRTIIHLALGTGLRLGELCGLEWRDIDFAAGTLTVNRASQSLSGLGTFEKAPKNETSNRCITLPKSIIDLLKEFKAWQNTERLRLGDKWHNSNRLFVQWNGQPVYVQSPAKWFKKFLERYNQSIDDNKSLTSQQKKELKLPIIRFHDLRHTSGSLLIAKGMPLKNVSSRLGHSDIRITANIYGHALQSVDRQIADTMDTILQAKK